MTSSPKIAPLLPPSLFVNRDVPYVSFREFANFAARAKQASLTLIGVNVKFAYDDVEYNFIINSTDYQATYNNETLNYTLAANLLRHSSGSIIVPVEFVYMVDCGFEPPENAPNPDKIRITCSDQSVELRRY